MGGPGWSRGRGPATSHSALRWHRPPDHLPKTFPLERDRATQRRTQNAERAGHWHWHWAVDGAWTVDRGPSDSACVRLIVADPAQQQQRTHHRLTGHCTPGPGVRGKRVGRRRQARVLESCSSPPVQHDVRLAARPQHSHPRPHPHLPHGGCEARLTRRRAALHVSMWCIAVWCCAVVLHGDSKPETRPSAPSTIAHRPCHPATLPPCRFRAAIADLHLPRDAPNVRRACYNWKQQSAPSHRHHVSEITKTNPRVQCSRALAVLQPPSETRCLSCVHPCSC